MRKLCFSLAILLLPLVYDAAWIPNARSQTEINVEFILHVDNERGIDFRQLKLFIQQQPVRYKAWTTVGSFVPDSSGRTRVKVPSQGALSVQLVTMDPTIRPANEPDNKLAFYSVGKTEPETIVREEFPLPENNQPEMTRTIELTRAAAFTPCIPAGIIKGTISFRPANKEIEQAINVWQFSDAMAVNESIIGGLMSGLWEVSYFDDKNVLRQQQLLVLTEGEILRRSCP